MLRKKFTANRTNHCEDIQLYVNFSFSSAAIVDFEQNVFLTLKLSGSVQMMLTAKSDQRCGSYSSLCKFKNGSF